MRPAGRGRPSRPGNVGGFLRLPPGGGVGCSSSGQRRNGGLPGMRPDRHDEARHQVVRAGYEPERIFWVMRRAFSLAMNGQPGPVYIDIPKDVGLQEVAPPLPAREYPLRTSPDPSASSKRPSCFGRRSVRSSWPGRRRERRAFTKCGSSPKRSASRADQPGRTRHSPGRSPLGLGAHRPLLFGTRPENIRRSRPADQSRLAQRGFSIGEQKFFPRRPNIYK